MCGSRIANTRTRRARIRFGKVRQGCDLWGVWMSMFKFSKPQLALVLLILAAAGGFQLYIRQSPAYAKAVATYRAEHVEPTEIGLCLLCSSRVTYGNGIWHYRFTLVVEQGDSTRKVLVRSQSLPGTDEYSVRFE